MDARLRPRLGAVKAGRGLEPRGPGACLSGGRGALVVRRPPSESNLNMLDSYMYKHITNTHHTNARRARCAAVCRTRSGSAGTTDAMRLRLRLEKGLRYHDFDTNRAVLPRMPPAPAHAASALKPHEATLIPAGLIPAGRAATPPEQPKLPSKHPTAPSNATTSSAAAHRRNAATPPPGALPA